MNRYMNYIYGIEVARKNCQIKQKKKKYSWTANWGNGQSRG